MRAIHWKRKDIEHAAIDELSTQGLPGCTHEVWHEFQAVLWAHLSARSKLFPEALDLAEQPPAGHLGAPMPILPLCVRELIPPTHTTHNLHMPIHSSVLQR